MKKTVNVMMWFAGLVATAGLPACGADHADSSPEAAVGQAQDVEIGVIPRASGADDTGIDRWRVVQRGDEYLVIGMAEGGVAITTYTLRFDDEGGRQTFALRDDRGGTLRVSREGEVLSDTLHRDARGHALLARANADFAAHNGADAPTPYGWDCKAAILIAAGSAVAGGFGCIPCLAVAGGFWAVAAGLACS